MSDHKQVVELLFRTKYGEVLAALLGRVGYEQFELVEEAVQTAFQKALEKWSADNLPQNPGGWLYVVARNSYLELLRRRQTEQVKLEQIQAEALILADETAGFNEEMQPDIVLDDLAMMILLCCNPQLNPKAQVCLTLKSACGFSVKEISRALGMQEEATKKIITRAKQQVAREQHAFSKLITERIESRFTFVQETIYAMFNEGYAASSGETHLRRDIAEEAIRLATIFLHTTLTPPQQQGELQALFALMVFQTARFDARTSPSGLPIRLQAQDRTKWNREMIVAGLNALAASQSSEQLTALHIEARIAAEHATSPSYGATRWPTILTLYNQLLTFKDTPEARLSRIVALHHAEGWQTALAEIDLLKVDTLSQSFLLHAIRAELLESAGKPTVAKEEWQKAHAKAPTTADRSFIEQKLNELS